jgi:hypothetical protein
MELPKMKMQNFDDLFGMNSGAVDISEYMADGKVIEVELDNLVDFMDHPFKVLDDDRMAEMIESVRQYGVMNPALVRLLPGGKYEIIAGHRRKYACKKLGLVTMPVRVLELEEEDAIILMVARLLGRKAVEKGFPVIIVESFVDGIGSFIDSIEQEILVLFDEFDKTFASNKDEGIDPQSSMLSLFDGVAQGKKVST